MSVLRTFVTISWLFFVACSATTKKEAIFIPAQLAQLPISQLAEVSWFNNSDTYRDGVIKPYPFGILLKIDGIPIKTEDGVAYLAAGKHTFSYLSSATKTEESSTHESSKGTSTFESVSYGSRDGEFNCNAGTTYDWASILQSIDPDEAFRVRRFNIK